MVSVLDCSPFFPFSVFPKSMATTPPKRRLFETKFWPPKLKFDTWSLNTCPQRSSEPPSFSFALDLGHQSNFYLDTTSTFSKLTLQHAYIYIYIYICCRVISWSKPFASDFYHRPGYRKEFCSENHFYPFSSQKKSRFASDFLRRGNRASWSLKKSRDFSGSGKNRRRNRRESRDFGALSS